MPGCLIQLAPCHRVSGHQFLRVFGYSSCCMRSSLVERFCCELGPGVRSGSLFGVGARFGPDSPVLGWAHGRKVVWFRVWCVLQDGVVGISCGYRSRRFFLSSPGTTFLVVCLRRFWVFCSPDPTEDSGKGSGSGSWPGFSGEASCRGMLSFLVKAKSRERVVGCGPVRADGVYSGWFLWVCLLCPLLSSLVCFPFPVSRLKGIVGPRTYGHLSSVVRCLSV